MLMPETKKPEKKEPEKKEPEKKEPEKKESETKDVIKPIRVTDQSVGKKFASTFFKGSLDRAVKYAVSEVILPAIKNMVSDAIGGGVERLLFGESRNRRSSVSMVSRGSTIDYTRYARPERFSEPRRTRDISEMVFATRVECEEVLSRLDSIIDKYGVASVTDLHEIVGVTGTYVDDNWGWKSLSRSAPRRIRDGYILEMPEPEHIGR